MNQEVKQALKNYLNRHQPATIHGTAERIAMLIWMQDHTRCVSNILEALVEAERCRASGEEENRVYLLSHTAFA